MSVLVTMRVPGDTDRFRQFVANEQERVTQAGEQAKAQGCLHHRFGVGDGFVVVVDEWESPEHFQRFFENPELAEMMRDSGAQGEPEVTFTEAIETPDQF